MLKKVLSVFLTTVFVASLVNLKVVANTTEEPQGVKNHVESLISKPDNKQWSDKSVTLGDALKSGKFSNLIDHRAKERNISFFSDNYQNLRTGNLNNVVINVRFKGEAEFLTTINKGQPMREIFNNLYNDSNLSLNSYFNEVSDGKLDLDTSFVGMDTNNSQSIELNHERNYYRPYSKKNPTGYFEHVVVNATTGEFVANMYNRTADDTVADLDPTDGVVSNDFVSSTPNVMSLQTYLYSYEREMRLLQEITSKANANGILDVNLDKNGDGILDALTLMVGLADSQNLSNELAWGELLWPHQGSVNLGLSQQDIVDINYILNLDLGFLLDDGFKLADNYIDRYNLYTSDYVLYDGISVQSNKGEVGFVGLVCHEMSHVLNLPDLYNYTNQFDGCVGMWDLMAYNGVVPQYINSYLRKEAGWLSDSQLPTIQSDGEYELKPVSSANGTDVNGYVISLPEYPGQFFFVEYRKSEGLFDGGQYSNIYRPGVYKTINDDESGLVIYRVDTNVANVNNMLTPGNFNGYPFNIYVFRPESAPDNSFERNAALNGTDRVSYGNIDPSVIKNAITFQDGTNLVNSRVLINNVKVDPVSNKIKFTVDAKDPSIVNAGFINDSIVVELDENIGDTSNLNLIQVKKNGVLQNIKAVKASEANKVEISLLDGSFDGEYTLTIPKDSIKDTSGKSLVNDYSKNLSRILVINTTGVTLDKTTLELKLDETAQLTATVMPTNATNKDVTWSSSDESIAKVDTTGKVTAIKEGTAEISVKTIDGNFIAKCKVTITKKSEEPVTPPTDNNTDNNGGNTGSTENSGNSGNSGTTNTTSSSNSSNVTSTSKLPYTGQEVSLLQIGFIVLLLGAALTFKTRSKSKN